MEHHYDHDLLDAFASAALVALITEPQWGDSESLVSRLNAGKMDQGAARNYAAAAFNLAEAMMAESASRPKGGR